MTSKCYRCGKPAKVMGGEIHISGVTLNPSKYYLCKDHLALILRFIEGKSGAIDTFCMTTRQHSKMKLAIQAIDGTLDDIKYGYTNLGDL